jgi:cytochrome c oxidase cbb3-type subunit III
MTTPSQDHENTVIDAVTGTATTGHDWDGIKELNTPLPRWWLNVFYITIVWAIGYWIVYPAWPLVSDYSRGVLGYASRTEIELSLAELRAQRAAQAAGLATATLEEIKGNPALFRIAMAQGRSAFGDNCAACHGAGGAGAKGFPNLNDDDWLWGGTLEAIHFTLLNGIRVAGNTDTRLSQMPAFGRDGLLKKDEIESVSNYVRQLASLEPEKGADLAKGKSIYAEQCAACHGEAGKGNLELGAPNLTDPIWLYGNSVREIAEMVRNSRAGVMPAWSGRLDPVTIKALTVYVHSLGGGQ